jgi:hypothetical protein
MDWTAHRKGALDAPCGFSMCNVSYFVRVVGFPWCKASYFAAHSPHACEIQWFNL